MEGARDKRRTETMKQQPRKSNSKDQAAERLRRRAVFLAELAEARALRERVAPRRTKAARMREELRMRTFRG